MLNTWLFSQQITLNLKTSLLKIDIKIINTADYDLQVMIASIPDDLFYPETKKEELKDLPDIFEGEEDI